MDSDRADKARQEFEELLAAAWAEQLAQLRIRPDSDDSTLASSDRAAHLRERLLGHEARSGKGAPGHD